MTRSGETGHLNGQPCAGSVIAFTGSPIGWGSGQKYEEDEDGEFYLVAGGEPEENDSAKVDQDISVNDILRMFFKS